MAPDGTEQALEDAEVGLPDRYRYYPMGHVYFSIPKFERGTEVVYRMEYELVGALSPSWAIGAGKGPLGRPMSFDPPLDRLHEVVADLREAWPPRDDVFRLDHDVLLPSRDGPGFVVERVDYHLSFDTTWKLVNPDAELGVAQIDKDYRVRQLFARVVDEVPAGVDARSPRVRWLAAASVVVVAPALWLVFMLCEWLGSRLAGRVTLESMSTKLSTLAPEAVATLLAGRFGTDPTLEGILARMAGEKKLAIEVEPVAMTPPRKKASPVEATEESEEDDDDETPVVVRLRRLVPLENLPPLERDLLQKLLAGGRREVTSVELQSIYSKDGFEPWTVVKGLLPNDSKAPRSFLAGLLGLASLGGLVLQITSTAQPRPRTDHLPREPGLPRASSRLAPRLLARRPVVARRSPSPDPGPVRKRRGFGAPGLRQSTAAAAGASWAPRWWRWRPMEPCWPERGGPGAASRTPRCVSSTASVPMPDVSCGALSPGSTTGSSRTSKRWDWVHASRRGALPAGA